MVVELRARFDEEANIHSANRLEEAGAHLVYGVVGYKVHAKMILVVRQEENHFRNYVHLGTGNYHSRTAQFYTDYGLFTCDPAIGEDVHRLFLEITSLGKPPKLNKVLDSPFNLAAALTAKIEREAHHALAGKPARIIAKMNQLTEPGIIRSLYQASRAGVKIDLIIRGMCSLRPNIPEVSENIRVRSVVGRFLEHTRVVYFHNNAHPEMYCTSADWMEPEPLPPGGDLLSHRISQAAQKADAGTGVLSRRQCQCLGAFSGWHLSEDRTGRWAHSSSAVNSHGETGGLVSVCATHCGYPYECGVWRSRRG